MASPEGALPRPRTATLESRHLSALVGGWGCLVLGALLLVLPGPGIPLVIVGLALLATRYAWARRAMLVLNAQVRRFASNRSKTPPKGVGGTGG
jgi:hypothetical protein